MPICHKSELRVYNKLGTGTPVNLPATNISWSWKLGGDGAISFTVDDRVEPLASNPRLLDDCVVKVAIPLTEPGTAFTEVAAYAVRGRNGTLWSPKGGSNRVVSGAPTLFTVWAQDAILHPESNEIAQMSLPERYFGWMSTIYDPVNDAGQWGTPTANAGQQDSTTGDRAGNPDGWPTALGNAYWITRGSVSNGQRHLFIAECTVPTDSYVTVYFSADESCAVYFGGQLVIQTSSSETGYQTVSTWSAWVEAGTYRVGIDKTSVFTRGGDGRDPVLLAVATNDDIGEVADILLVTNTSDWEIYTTDPDIGEVPSLTPGEIVLELHSQAVARGVSTWNALTLGFTATTDSDGKTWPNREERAWRIAYDRYFDMIEGLGDLDFAPEITPGLVFNAYSKRGTDRSATVTLSTLDELASVSERGTGIEGSYMPVETQDGWVIVQNAAAEAAVGRRETALSLGNAPSIAQGKRLGQKVLDDRLAIAETERPVEFYARDGAVPFQDFFIGDTVTLVVDGSTTKGIVLDVAAAQSSVEGILRWTATVSGDGVTGETVSGRFNTQPAQALAEGGVGSLVDVPPATFVTLGGSAAASGELGEFTDGSAIFFAIGEGVASASGELSEFNDGSGIFDASGVGVAAAAGEVGSFGGVQEVLGVQVVERIGTGSSSATTLTLTPTMAQEGDVLVVVHATRGSSSNYAYPPTATDLTFDTILAGTGAYTYLYFRASMEVQPDSTQRTISMDIGGTQSGWGHSAILFVLRGAQAVAEASPVLTYSGSNTVPEVAPGGVITDAGSIGFNFHFTNYNSNLSGDYPIGYDDWWAAGSSNQSLGVAWSTESEPLTLPDVDWWGSAAQVGYVGSFAVKAES